MLGVYSFGPLIGVCRLLTFSANLFNLDFKPLYPLCILSVCFFFYQFSLVGHECKSTNDSSVGSFGCCSAHRMLQILAGKNMTQYSYWQFSCFSWSNHSKALSQSTWITYLFCRSTILHLDWTSRFSLLILHFIVWCQVYF